MDDPGPADTQWRRQYASMRAGLFSSMLLITAVIFYALYHRHHTLAAFLASGVWLVVDLTATVLLLRQAHRRLLQAHRDTGTL